MDVPHYLKSVAVNMATLSFAVSPMPAGNTLGGASSLFALLPAGPLTASTVAAAPAPPLELHDDVNSRRLHLVRVAAEFMLTFLFIEQLLVRRSRRLNSSLPSFERPSIGSAVEQTCKYLILWGLLLLCFAVIWWIVSPPGGNCRLLAAATIGSAELSMGIGHFVHASRESWRWAPAARRAVITQFRGLVIQLRRVCLCAWRRLTRLLFGNRK